MARSNMFRVGILLVLAALLSSCKDSPTTSLAADQGSDLGTAELVWQEGSLNTKVFRKGPLAVRCFPSGPGFDCIVASEMAYVDSPRRERIYYRAQLLTLPRTFDALNSLEITDGYQCRVRGRPGNRLLIEVIWSDIQTTERRSREGTKDVPWNPAELFERLSPLAPTLVRPYFPCLLVDSEVYRSGLDGLDSAILDYETVTGTDPRLSR